MNKLIAMQTFVQIVESGSLTSAAEVLDTSLPTVVRTLANLEEFLDTRLLNRTTRRITLTEEGQQYLLRCQSILSDIENAELELSRQQTKASGKLRVTSSVTFGTFKLSRLIEEFLEENDKVVIDLMLLDRNVNLVDEGVDVAVRIGHLADSSMVARRVGSVRHVLCAAPQLIEKYCNLSHPKQLSEWPCVRFAGLSHANQWRFLIDGQERAYQVDGPLICNQVTAMLNAVNSGVGVGSFLSYQVEDLVNCGELQILLPEFELPVSPVSVVYPSAKLMSARVRIFVDWITDKLREEMARSQI